MDKYTIGIDFGTQSGRGVLVRVRDGQIISEAEFFYPHGLLEKALPDGTPIPPGFALHDPTDYELGLSRLPHQLLADSGIPPQAVIAIGVDSTACSPLPVDDQFRPLSTYPEFQTEPHAYLKLWKHRTAVEETRQLNQLAAARSEAFLANTGGICDCEAFFPKVLEVFHQAPKVYHAAAHFMELSDWLTALLCGELVRNSCTASYKAYWNPKTGFPSSQFFRALEPGFEAVVEEKLRGTVRVAGSRAGLLTDEAAARTGLCPGIAVSAGHGDAHVAFPAVGITEPGKMLLILGTSGCNMLVDHTLKPVPGICGVAADGIIPGFYGYEAGQCAVGDFLNWIATQAISPEYARVSNVHGALTEKAAALKPGESGLLMLNWLGGNRSILINSQLSGMIIGLTLATRPEELYRSAIEALAFGQRVILENYQQHGISVHQIFACGGIARKNPLLMQVYADVLNLPIHVCACDQVPAVGSAIFAAAAAGACNGGYDSVYDASQKMRQPWDRVYTPCQAHQSIYASLYQEYRKLYFLYGKENDLMPRLRSLRNQVKESIEK